MMVMMSQPITIRHSTDRDRARVLQLAELDGRPPPVIDDGSAVADPFRPSADLVALLHARAEQERVNRVAA
jgi:hypothetical protein